MKPLDLTNKKFGELTALYKSRPGMWMCRCSCDRLHEVSVKNLTSGRVQSCGHTRSKFGDLTGQTFGEWTVIEKVKGGRYRCKCSCDTERIISSTDLISGKSKSCGHARKAEDLTGKIIGEWEVLYKTTNYKYMCRCSCNTMREVNQSDLAYGKSKSCGHAVNKLVDLTGQKFGSWTVLKHIGYGKWLCKCECDTTKIIRHTELLNGDSKSCGCKQKELLRDTMLSRYGELASCRISDKRTSEQIRYIESAENLKDAIISNFSYKPLVYELEPLLGITYSRIIQIIHSFGLDDYVTLYEMTSRYENEICNIIHDFDTSIEIIQRAKIFKDSPLKEVDIYIPSKRIAIEFNGDYWHSELFKDRLYHQNKTIACAKLGIQLIHIFEYEWNNPLLRDKIISLLLNRISSDNTIYARICTVRKLDTSSSELRDFVNTNHLQGHINCKIAYGLYLDSNLLSAITFGVPRYSNNFEYELLRLVYKQGINIIGGTKKLFNAFINDYNPSSIISYCDISKFNGGVYKRIGFESTQDSITSPNYVWINFELNDIKTRYQTQKHRLIKDGLGKYGESESEIMHKLGYVRIYDCGNLKFEWTNK